MKDIQCRLGHWFSPKSHDDTSCPYCNKSEQELLKTQPQYLDSESYPKTKPVFSSEKNVSSENQNKTVPHYFGADEFIVNSNQEVSIRPVVGWLVCIDGPEKGKDYRITVGRNFIGRNPERQINIEMDNSISRDIHAEIMFEPNEQQFMILNGNSSELSYLNKKVVIGHQQLNKFDKLVLGKSEFLFIPLCGDDFNWKAD